MVIFIFPSIFQRAYAFLFYSILILLHLICANIIGSGAEGSSIPAVCITIEEAELFERLYLRKKRIVVHLSIKSATVGRVTSRNTIFDLSGSTWPEEIVLLSAHIDSWDVGQGALDDGGGMAAVFQAMSALMALGKESPIYVPKR